MRPILILIGVLVFFSSCRKVQQIDSEQYFSVDQLVDEQIGLFLLQQSALDKLAIINNDSAQVALTPDSLAWNNEFQIIKAMDINKPALIGQYKVEQRDDPNSNLTILSYQARNKNLKIESLEIYYLNSIDNIKYIEIEGRQTNSIFELFKKVNLTFDKTNDKLMLEEYTVEGYQKMLLQDQVKFYIKGQISQ